MMNPQMYQNVLMQQQQQYMRNFLPGGKSLLLCLINLKIWIYFDV